MDGSIVFVSWHHCAPQLMHASLGPTELTFQAASRSVWPFCRAHDSDRQTERPRYSVCNNSPRCGLKTTTTITTTFIRCWRHGKAIARVLPTSSDERKLSVPAGRWRNSLGLWTPDTIRLTCESSKIRWESSKAVGTPPPTWGVLSHVGSGCRSTPVAYAQFHKCNAVATCC